MDAPAVLTFSGCAEYLDAHPEQQDTQARIFVKFRPRGVDRSLHFLALLDTGGCFCILHRDVADLLGEHLTSRLDRVKLRTARGLIQGDLHRHGITIIADAGESLEIDSLVFVSPEWEAANFLGYTGTLDRARFAIDPSRNLFYFTSPDLEVHA